MRVWKGRCTVEVNPVERFLLSRVKGMSCCVAASGCAATQFLVRLQTTGLDTILRQCRASQTSLNACVTSTTSSDPNVPPYDITVGS